MSSPRRTVPGEALPWFAAPLVTFLGIATTATVVASLRTASAAPLVAPTPPASTPVTTPERVAPSPVAPSRVAAVPEPVAAPGATPPACPPLYVNFERSSAHLPNGAAPSLTTFAKWLSAHPTVKVTLDGHADSRGNEHSNLRLSRERAQAVANAILAAGADHAQLTVRGFGSFLPVEAEADDAAINRRVVVHTKGDACPRDKEETIPR